MRRFIRGLGVLAVLGLASRLARLPGAAFLLAQLRGWSAYASGATISVLQALICLAALRLTRGMGLRRALRELGLLASPLRPLAFALVVTSPMLIGYAATSSLDRQATVVGLLFGAFLWPLAEEILYRGYAFGQLYRHAGWGFWPAALATAAVFGFGHLYQMVTGDLTLLGGLGVFLITATGSVLFSWLFLRWSFNLWVPSGVHALMNLWWMLFAVDQTALGGWLANAARAGTVVLAIVVTLVATPSPRRAQELEPASRDDAPPLLREAMA